MRNLDLQIKSGPLVSEINYAYLPLAAVRPSLILFDLFFN